MYDAKSLLQKVICAPFKSYYAQTEGKKGLICAAGSGQTRPIKMPLIGGGGLSETIDLFASPISVRGSFCRVY